MRVNLLNTLSPWFIHKVSGWNLQADGDGFTECSRLFNVGQVIPSMAYGLHLIDE